MNVVLVSTAIFDDTELKRRAYAGFSAARRRKIDSLRFEKDKRLSLAAGAALDHCLWKLNTRERSVHFGAGKYGKPYIENMSGVFFNLSHSGSFAVCAMSGQDIGADVECITECDASLINAVCTTNEAQSLFALDEDKRRSEFCRLWTIKESCLKYTGAGLNISPQSVEAAAGTEGAALLCSGQNANVYFWQKYVSGHWLSVCTARPEQVAFQVITQQEVARLYG